MSTRQRTQAEIDSIIHKVDIGVLRYPKFPGMKRGLKYDEMQDALKHSVALQIEEIEAQMRAITAQGSCTEKPQQECAEVEECACQQPGTLGEAKFIAPGTLGDGAHWVELPPVDLEERQLQLEAQRLHNELLQAQIENQVMQTRLLASDLRIRSGRGGKE
jgi:hypothetical protein